MSVLLAPTARRMPISLVRSVTETSMMFIMTIPPTTDAMEEIKMNTIKKAELMLDHKDRKVAEVAI